MNEFAFKKKKKAQQELQQVNGRQGGMLPDAVSETIQRKRGSGTPLSDEQNKTYSSALGRNMSDVRIHSDAESDALSRSLNARAFTIGSDIFLSQGINPARGGQDQATLTHEMTHVAQQNGQAGTGSLRLGAADTAQEHEAENAAAGDIHAGLSSHDTVQRGILSGIGNAFLSLFGAKEAYDRYTSAQDRVKNAVESMKEHDEDVYSRFTQLKDQIAAAANFLETKKAAQKAAQAAFYAQTREANQNSAHGENVVLDREELDEADAEYNQAYSDYEELRERRLGIVQRYGNNITQEDLDKYDGGKAKKFFTVFSESGFGSAILGLFGYRRNQAQPGDDRAAEAAPQEGPQENAGEDRDDADIDIHVGPNLNEQAAAGNKKNAPEYRKYRDRGINYEGQQVSIEGEVRNILTEFEQASNLTDELFDEIAQEEHLDDYDIDLNEIRPDMLPLVHEKVTDAMIPLLDEAPEVQELADAEARKNEITQICAQWEEPYKEGLELKQEYEKACQILEQHQEEKDKPQEKNEKDAGVKKDPYNYLNEQFVDEMMKNAQEGSVAWANEVIAQWKDKNGVRGKYESARFHWIEEALNDRDRSYKKTGMPIEKYISTTKGQLRDMVRRASYDRLKDRLTPEQLEELKKPLRIELKKKVKELKEFYTGGDDAEEAEGEGVVNQKDPEGEPEAKNEPEEQKVEAEKNPKDRQIRICEKVWTLLQSQGSAELRKEYPNSKLFKEKFLGSKSVQTFFDKFLDDEPDEEAAKLILSRIEKEHSSKKPMQDADDDDDNLFGDESRAQRKESVKNPEEKVEDKKEDEKEEGDNIDTDTYNRMSKLLLLIWEMKPKKLEEKYGDFETFAKEFPEIDDDGGAGYLLRDYSQNSCLEDQELEGCAEDIVNTIESEWE